VDWPRLVGRLRVNNDILGLFHQCHG
jgi:hypothetical protein